MRVKGAGVDVTDDLQKCEELGIESLCLTVEWTPILGGLIVIFAVLTLALYFA